MTKRAKILALAVGALLIATLAVVLAGQRVWEARVAELERAAEEAKAAAQEEAEWRPTLRYYHDPDDPLAGVVIIKEYTAPPKPTKRETPNYRPDYYDSQQRRKAASGQANQDDPLAGLDWL